VKQEKKAKKHYEKNKKYFGWQDSKRGGVGGKKRKTCSSQPGKRREIQQIQSNEKDVGGEAYEKRQKGGKNQQTGQLFTRLRSGTEAGDG